MSPLQLIIKREYLQDIRSRSFWLGTFVLPVLMLGFGCFIGWLSADSDTMQDVAGLGVHKPSSQMGGLQIMGLISSMFLIIFLMTYGSMIFNKVKAEKTSRIMEMLASTVTGRAMMLGKVISVALTGLTQMFVWGILIITGGVVLLTAIGHLELLSYLTDGRLWLGIIYAVVYFIGGYLMYGSLYATIGAMTDRDNENQGYMVVLTFVLMASFYISSFAIDNPTSPVTLICSFIPFTSPGIGAMAAISGALSWWQILLSVGILYICAWLSISLAGKVYTSAMLLNGTKFSIRDILTFLRSK